MGSIESQLSTLLHGFTEDGYLIIRVIAGITPLSTTKAVIDSATSKPDSHT
jgi:hypothetical protein